MDWKWWENVKLRLWQTSRIDGELCFDPKVLERFIEAPFDILPNFQPPAGSTLIRGRGKDHPRYGRFIYAFAYHYRPARIVELGSYAGGTSIGWGAAIRDNGLGELTCIDNDTYCQGTYPEVTRENLRSVGLSDQQFELRCGDSKQLIPAVSQELARQVDIYLVDADHTYEGALADMQNGLPMLRDGGFMLVHDVDRSRKMDEETSEHPHPVYEAFQEFVGRQGYSWCILRFIRKHLGIIRIDRAANKLAAVA